MGVSILRLLEKSLLREEKSTKTSRYCSFIQFYSRNLLRKAIARNEHCSHFRSKLSCALVLWSVFIIEGDTNAAITVIENHRKVIPILRYHCSTRNFRCCDYIEHISSIEKLNRLDRLLRVDHQHESIEISVPCLLYKVIECYKKVGSECFHQLLGLVHYDDDWLGPQKGRQAGLEDFEKKETNFLLILSPNQKIHQCCPWIGFARIFRLAPEPIIDGGMSLGASEE